MADNKLSAQVTIDTKQAVTSLAGLNKSVKGSAEVLAKLKPSANSGGQALQNLSRIASDAPFGFIAIQNNIDPLIESFGRLKAETGSTKAAFGAILSSMIGPAGVAFAFTAISAGVTHLIQKYGSLGNAFQALMGNIKPLTEEQKAFAKAQNDSAVSIQKQRIETEQLVKVAKGDIGSKAEQIAALAQLNKSIPDYIGVLTEANIKTAEGAKIIDTYTSALVKQATAELLTQRAAELAVKQIDSRSSLIKTLRDNTLKQLALEKEVEKLRERQSKTIGSGYDAASAAIVGLKANIEGLKNANKKALDDFVRDGKLAKKEIDDLKKQIDLNTVIIDTSDDAKEKVKRKLKEFIVTAISEFVSELKLKDIPLPKLDTVNIDVPFKFNVPNKDQDAFDVARQAIEGFVEQLKQDAKVASVNLGNVLNKEIARGLSGIQSLIKSYTDNGLEPDAFVTAEAVAKVQERLKAIADAFITLQTNIRAILSTFTADAFAGIGEVIGAGIADGAEGIKKAAAGIGALIGGLFVNLGKEMIKASALITALKAALKTFQGPASLAAGIALVALGSALKAKLGNIGATAFATGGIVTGPTLGMVGEAGQPEVILPLNKINQFLDGGGQGNGEALTLAVSGDVFTFGLARNARKQSRLY